MKVLLLDRQIGFAAIAGFAFLQESFTPFLFVGGSCVLLGVALVNQQTD
jgi:drug/metabolite transporter (DMT)-like permease